ncbi:MAG: hypothetical protein N4A76_10050 [Firmicutes bacterium]|jgi:hypothetical protein|nr:hypothetical protein [Bacillota bacterium]
MKINNISPYNVPKNNYDLEKAKVKAGDREVKKSEKDEKAVVYEKGDVEEKVGQYKIDQEKIDKIKGEFNQNVNAFREMVREMFEKQGINVEELIKRLEDGEVIELEIDQEVIDKAKENVSEDGYFGVEKTAKRILDFAKAISGGNPEKIQLLKDAFIEGFEEAKEIFGGELPEISEKTYEKVMEGFDEWEKEND